MSSRRLSGEFETACPAVPGVKDAFEFLRSRVPPGARADIFRAGSSGRPSNGFRGAPPPGRSPPHSPGTRSTSIPAPDRRIPGQYGERARLRRGFLYAAGYTLGARRYFRTLQGLRRHGLPGSTGTAPGFEYDFYGRTFRLPCVQVRGDPQPATPPLFRGGLLGPHVLGLPRLWRGRLLPGGPFPGTHRCRSTSEPWRSVGEVCFLERFSGNHRFSEKININTNIYSVRITGSGLRRPPATGQQSRAVLRTVRGDPDRLSTPIRPGELQAKLDRLRRKAKLSRFLKSVVEKNLVDLMPVNTVLWKTEIID